MAIDHKTEIWLAVGGIAVTIVGVIYSRRSGAAPAAIVGNSQPAQTPAPLDLSGASLDPSAGGLLGQGPDGVAGAQNPGSATAPLVSTGGSGGGFNGTGLSIDQLIALNQTPTAPVSSAKPSTGTRPTDAIPLFESGISLATQLALSPRGNVNAFSTLGSKGGAIGAVQAPQSATPAVNGPVRQTGIAITNGGVPLGQSPGQNMNVTPTVEGATRIAATTPLHTGNSLQGPVSSGRPPASHLA